MDERRAVRRGAVAAEAERRSLERRSRVGGEIRSMRLRRDWSQEALARRAAVGRLVISRVERAVGALDVDVLEHVAIGFGVPLMLGFGREPGASISDAGHLAMQELVLRVGRRAGYVGRFEVAASNEPWRSTDVELRSDARRWLVVAECWNTFSDIGAAARSTMRKTAEADARATALWGQAGRARSVWIVRATARNHDLVARYPEVFASRFPGSSRGWVDALTIGADPPDRPGLVWSDVGATRLYAWRKAPAIRGSES
jgi:transcriptional regulator with XRE-family HTH domain